MSIENELKYTCKFEDVDYCEYRLMGTPSQQVEVVFGTKRRKMCAAILPVSERSHIKCNMATIVEIPTKVV